MTTRHTLAIRGLVITAAVGAGFFAGSRHLVQRQAAAARALIGKPLGESAPVADRTWKRDWGERIELLVLGDSIAAGLGAEQPRHTPGARLAKKLTRRTRRACRLRTAAVVGSESSALAAQLDALAVDYRPDLAVIIVGGNDVTHRVPISESTAHLAEAIGRLHARGAEVIVGTCPDLAALPALPQPLRALASRSSRQLAEAQRHTALSAGARAVSLADVVGPFFATNPDEMFSLDRFHPSSTGYKRTAQALLPSALAALGYAESVPFGHYAPVSSA